jgi:hypothetical protein
MFADKNKNATKVPIQQKTGYGTKTLQSVTTNYTGIPSHNKPLQLKAIYNTPITQLQIIANDQTSPSLKHDGALDGLNSIESKRDEIRQQLIRESYLADKAEIAPPEIDDIEFSTIFNEKTEGRFTKGNPMVGKKKKTEKEIITRPRSKSLQGEIEEPMEGDGLYSVKEGVTHNLMSKASKVLTGKVGAEEFHRENPAYGILGEGKGPADKSTSMPGEDDGKSIGRLNKWFIEQPNDGAMKLAYHITTSENSAKGAATRIDGGFHNESGRFGGGFHVASDKPTGAMEVDHHKNDEKKKAAKQVKDAGGSEAEQAKAYQEAQEYNPTNYLTYDVSLSGGDIIDATGALTSMVMNRPKEIERAAREDNKDGILYKSSRGSGLALVLYKNYRSILALFDKPKAMTSPDVFSEQDKADRDALKNAAPTDLDIEGDRNPTTKISNKL